MNSTKEIVILGARGNHFDILDTLNEINAASKTTRYKCVGFLDDNPDRWNKVFFGIRVLGPLKDACKYPDAWFSGPIGSSSTFWKREARVAETGIPLEKFETLVHPSASVSNMSQLGLGVVIFQNVTVTSNIQIGNHVHILPNSVVSHDDVIGDYTSITGGVCVSGHVQIGKSCYLGTNSAIKEGVRIGEACLIGMGSVVLKDVPDNSVVVGSPARFLRHTRDT